MEGAASPIRAGPHPGRTRRTSRGGLEIVSFDALDAAVVASWLRTEEDLRILAPGTAPPISAAKVMGWRKERGLRFLLRPKSIDRADPIAYAELNPMPQSPEDYWIGHFIVNPIHRGRSIGTEFARSLLDKAFDEFAARSVILVVFPENASAIRCYEKAGMQIMGRERKYFETTRRSCEFLRMGIGRDAWRSQARQMPAHL